MDAARRAAAVQGGVVRGGRRVGDALLRSASDVLLFECQAAFTVELRAHPGAAMRARLDALGLARPPRDTAEPTAAADADVALLRACAYRALFVASPSLQRRVCDQVRARARAVARGRAPALGAEPAREARRPARGRAHRDGRGVRGGGGGRAAASNESAPSVWFVSTFRAENLEALAQSPRAPPLVALPPHGPRAPGAGGRVREQARSPVAPARERRGPHSGRAADGALRAGRPSARSPTRSCSARARVLVGTWGSSFSVLAADLGFARLLNVKSQMPQACEDAAEKAARDAERGLAAARSSCAGVPQRRPTRTSASRISCRR